MRVAGSAWPGLPQRSHDPDRARYLLRRAGLLGVRLPVYASPAAEGLAPEAVLLERSGARENRFRLLFPEEF